MEHPNQNMPDTLFGLKPTDLGPSRIGSVRARPFYQVPVSPSHSKSVLSDYAFPAFILDAYGSDMVRVQFESGAGAGPREQVFYMHELHRIGCMCRACAGDDPYPCGI